MLKAAPVSFRVRPQNPYASCMDPASPLRYAQDDGSEHALFKNSLSDTHSNITQMTHKEFLQGIQAGNARPTLSNRIEVLRARTTKCGGPCAAKPMRSEEHTSEL